MIGMARKLTATNKIQALSIPEIQHGLVKAALDLESKVKFRRNKLKPGPLMNAIALWFLTRTPGAQEEIAREFIAKLEGILESDNPVTLEADWSHPVAEGLMTVGEMKKIAKDAAAGRAKKSS